MYLLDTNTCIYVINHRPAQVFERFKQYPLGQLAISSITASELAFGVEKSGSERNKQALNKFLAPLEICPYNDQAIWHYAQLRHALALDAVLVTNNLKEFERVARLRLENWV